MAIFLDSANLDEAREAASFGFVEGVTTNPSLLAQAGHRQPEIILEKLCDLFSGNVFHQLSSRSTEELVSEGKSFIGFAPNLGIKIMCTMNGLMAGGRLANDFPIAMTGIFHPTQSYTASQCGAFYVIPYVNRITLNTGDGIESIRQMAGLLENTQTEIIAASLKNPRQVFETLQAGAQHVSLPLQVMIAMVENEMTAAALEKFERSK